MFELIQMARLFSGTTLLVSVVAIITVSPWLDDAIYFFCDSTVSHHCTTCCYFYNELIDLSRERF